MCLDYVREKRAGEKTWSQKGLSNKITDKTAKIRSLTMYALRLIYCSVII
jgi:hypothetical protein